MTTTNPFPTRYHRALLDVSAASDAYNAVLNDTANNGNNAVSPNGDDFNNLDTVLTAIALHALAQPDGPVLAVGETILSRRGEEDSDENDEIRKTGPNAIGMVERIAGPYPHQGYVYHTAFAPSGVCVALDDADLEKDARADYVIRPDWLPYLAEAKTLQR